MGVPFDTTAHTVSFHQPPPVPGSALPGSRGEHLLQCAYGTEDRAARFYSDQVQDRLLPAMTEFVGRMEMVFVATSDGTGECDASLRAGPAGFVQVLDEGHLAYPEYRGNGVHASLGNISENAHVGLLMVDFVHDLIGLHVNGRARIVDDGELRALHPGLPRDTAPGRRAERWVVVAVDEAYVHCRKHIPRMAPVRERRAWGTDDAGRKGGDYFGARAGRDDAGGGERTDAPALAPASVPLRLRLRFPSTTHLPAGAATARPLRTIPPPRVGGASTPRRRIRWLSS